jgi:hypothetical protein
MPTAVERLFDSFLNFDNAGEQLKLDDAFLKIDDAFLKLTDVNGDGFNFLKIEHDPNLMGTFNVVGESFIKVGVDFQKVDTALKLTDQFVTNLMGDHKIGDLLPAVDQDFKFLDHKIETTSTDLKILGVDFLKLDSSPNLEVFDHKVHTVADDFLKLGADMAADRDAFLKLGTDFLKLGGTDGEKGSPLDQAYKEFGGELAGIGRTFDTLAADFLKLGDALHGGGGGAGDSANTIGGTLSLIYREFHLLDGALAALGGGATELIGLLHPSNGNNGPPTVVDTQHQGLVTLIGISDTPHHGGA